MNPRNPTQAIPGRWRTALLVVLLLWSSAAAAINNCPCPAQEMAEEPPTLGTSQPVTDCHHEDRGEVNDLSPSTSDAAAFTECCPELALTQNRTRSDDLPKSPTGEEPEQADAMAWPTPRTLAAVRNHLQRDPPHLQPGVPAFVLFCCFRE